MRNATLSRGRPCRVCFGYATRAGVAKLRESVPGVLERTLRGTGCGKSEVVDQRADEEWEVSNAIAQGREHSERPSGAEG